MPEQPPKTELFASPQDAQDRADALLDKWNALVNQAVGPGVRPRGDIPKSIQQQIISDSARFRTFITRPTFGMWGVLRQQSDETQSDYATLKKWYAKYELRAQQVADAMPQGESLSPKAEPQPLPRKTTPTENLELASKTAINIAIAAGVVAGVGLLVSLLWSRNQS